jgi:hypothetical protein
MAESDQDRQARARDALCFLDTAKVSDYRLTVKPRRPVRLRIAVTIEAREDDVDRLPALAVID